MNPTLAITAVALLALNAGAGEVPVQTQHYQPIRQGKLRYVVSDSTLLMTPTSGTRQVKYAEICRGEVEIPVYDSLIPKSGGSYHPQLITCETQTARGPMQLQFTADSVLRSEFTEFEKSVNPSKELNIGFSLLNHTTEGAKPYTYEYYHTHTENLAQPKMNLRIQTTPLHTVSDGGDLQDQFYIRFEFLDDQQKDVGGA